MQLPRPHPADRALVRGQIIAVALLAAGYAAPWVLLSQEWGFPIWWAAAGVLGAAIVGLGIALLAHTHGRQLARRELETHRRRQATDRDEHFDPGAVEAERVDQVLSAAPAPAGSPEEAIAAVLDAVGPGGLPRASIADRLEERGVLVRPEDLSVLLGRLVAAGVARLTTDGWYVSETPRLGVSTVPMDPTLGGTRVDLRRRGGRAPSLPPRRSMRPGDRAAWAMLTRDDGEPADLTPADAAADTPVELRRPATREEINRLWDAPLPGQATPPAEPAAAPVAGPAEARVVAELVVEAVRATREDGIAKRTLRERLAAQGQPVDAEDLDVLLGELVAAGRLVRLSSWGRYRHPRYARG